MVGIGRGMSHPQFSEHAHYRHVSWNESDPKEWPHQPQLIIHCAAISSPGLCESQPEEAWNINLGYTERVCRWAEMFQAHLVFCSTDLVFEGYETAPSGGFSPWDTPKPASVYSRTKTAAEELVASLVPSAAIVRLSLMYGAGVGNLGGPLQNIEDALRRGEDISVFCDEWRTPVAVTRVVQFLHSLAQRKASGIFHCCGERLSRLELMEKLFPQWRSQFRVTSRLSYTGKPPRAHDVSLHGTVLE